MINVKDLRVGNVIICLTLLSPSIQFVTVTGTMLAAFDTHPETIEDYSPLPLAPPVLERLGFVMNDNSDFQKGKLIIYSGERTFYFWCKDIRENIYHSVQLDYLHQLQNLYYILFAGQELEVNF